MNNGLPEVRANKRISVSILTALALLIAAGCLVYAARPQATTAAAAGTSAASFAASWCTQPAIVAQVRLWPISAHPVIPPNEPAVVATVGGENILATDLEAQVAAIQANNQYQLATLPANAPAAVRAKLLEPVSQIRHDTLIRLINERLLVQEGKRLGLYATVSQAQQAAQKALVANQALAPTNPERLQFEAYLCAYHLTEVTFVSNPEVIQGYQAALTIAAVRSHFLGRLSPSGIQTSAEREAALASYEQQLWASGQVHIYLPAT